MKNSGIEIVGDVVHDGSPEQYIVVGVNRGGTSAVAKSLAALGIPAGEDFNDINYEDRRLAGQYRSGNWAEFKKSVTDYQTRYQRFAWKLPDSNRRLAKVASYFANPFFIFIYRDICAIAQRKQMTLGEETFEAMEESLDGYRRILKFVRRQRPVALHVSYEKMLVEPEAFARGLCAFCGFEPSEETLQRVVGGIEPSPARYVEWAEVTRQVGELKRHGYDGHLDSVTSTQVSGWLLKQGDDAPVRAELLVGGCKVAEILCDEMRDDLVAAGRSRTGRAGFRLDVKAGIIQPGAEVIVRPVGVTAYISYQHGYGSAAMEGTRVTS